MQRTRFALRVKHVTIYLFASGSWESGVSLHKVNLLPYLSQFDIAVEIVTLRGSLSGS